jgi:DNA polymerase-3 subunit delta
LAAVAELAPAYLLTGTDRPKVGVALRRLRDRIGAEATEQFSAFEASGEDVVAACNSLGLFATERRLVVVEDVERWKAADVKAVAAYLDDPTPTTVLALVAGELKRDAPLAKAVAAAGEILAYDLPQRGKKADLPAWVESQFSARRTKVGRSACSLLVELVGENLDELGGEVDKLMAWADGAEIGEREIAELVVPRAELPPFALTDAWGRRDVAGVLEAVELLLERSGDAARDSLARIIGLVTSHVTRVAECQALAAAGVPARAAAERLKRNAYYVQKLYEQAGNYTADELRDAIVRLASLDLALKGKSRLAPELEVERALVEITRPAEAPALAS